MAINFETVTGNQTSANVLTQINNNFAKINLGSGLNADTVDNKHASELIPGATTFLDSITSLDDLGVGRYFCTQSEQDWEPVTIAGSRTFLIEVSLDIPNSLKSYKINYIAGEGAGESYYSDYSNGSIKWNRIVTNGNIENYNYFIFNNRKIQPVLAHDGYCMVENNKQANLITDDGTKYFKISASEPVNSISTITIEMYNTDTDELLDIETITLEYSSNPAIYNCYSDNNTIMFCVTNVCIYVITFSENLITTVERVDDYNHKTYFNQSLHSKLNDGRYSNDNYIVGISSEKSDFRCYNKAGKIFTSNSFNTFNYDFYTTLTPYISQGFLSRNANILAGMGTEIGTQTKNGITSTVYRVGAFIYNINSSTYTRLKLGSVSSILDKLVGISLNSIGYGGIVIVGNFVYVSFSFDEPNTPVSGIFKFDATNGNYIGTIPYDKARNLKLLYQDDKTILCVDNANIDIFEIDVDSFTIRRKYEDNYSLYTLNPTKTQVKDWIPPCALNDRYHKIAVNKFSSGGVSKIDYYMGYNDYWVDIGGV